jgi:hypothetical protein
MRLLLLHASSEAMPLTQRRVLHFVIGTPVLPLRLHARRSKDGGIRDNSRFCLIE